MISARDTFRHRASGRVVTVIAVDDGGERPWAELHDGETRTVITLAGLRDFYEYVPPGMAQAYEPREVTHA